MRNLIPLILLHATLTTLSACNSGSNGAGDTPNSLGNQTTTEPTTTSKPTSEQEVFGAPDICTTEGLNNWVYAQMLDRYIYFDQLPIVDPSTYPDASNLLDDLRIPPDIYSSISNPIPQNVQLAPAGTAFGFGVVFGVDLNGVTRIREILGNSPMEASIAQRGDQILAVNGIPIENLTSQQYIEFLGPLDVPTPVIWTLARADTPPIDVEVTSSTFLWNTVKAVDTFNVNGSTVGYIESAIFLQPSEAQLDAAIARIIEAEPSDLIIDFRYNIGGLVSIAQKLTSQILGPNFVNQPFLFTSYNSRYEVDNHVRLLEAQEISLALPRIVFLTTGMTASASEFVAHALSPYIDVVLIGENTEGKQFVSTPVINCNRALSAMNGITTNQAGESVLGGLIPTCPIQDEIQFPMNDPRDALLGAALNFVETGTCPNVIFAAASRSQNFDALNVFKPTTSFRYWSTKTESR